MFLKDFPLQTIQHHLTITDIICSSWLLAMFISGEWASIWRLLSAASSPPEALAHQSMD